ncbi:MAG TPA: hypothetical protein VFP69_17275 [Streptomyces sp.]|nr:hypothetical protein [Streptomyces sp.]
MPTTSPQQPRQGPQFFIAAAIEDWWVLTDPAAPFDPRPVAERVEQYLLGSGYYIAPDADTCDASHATGIGAVGPCVLHRDHDGPVHRDATGATWWQHPPRTRPSRAATAVLAALVPTCLTGTAAALAYGNWGWAVTGAAGFGVLGCALLDAISTRRRGERT